MTFVHLSWGQFLALSLLYIYTYTYIYVKEHMNWSRIINAFWAKEVLMVLKSSTWKQGCIWPSGNHQPVWQGVHREGETSTSNEFAHRTKTCKSLELEESAWTSVYWSLWFLRITFKEWRVKRAGSSRSVKTAIGQKVKILRLNSCPQ